jgi:hypothetical protein
MGSMEPNDPPMTSRRIGDYERVIDGNSSAAPVLNITPAARDLFVLFFQFLEPLVSIWANFLGSVHFYLLRVCCSSLPMQKEALSGA